VNWDDVFSVVCAQLKEVLPDVTADEIRPETSMADLGANSIDRMDVVVSSQDELGIRVPAAEFSDVRNLQGLVDVLHMHCDR
jgi:polyketide biosynthesis acyl carrier protein